MHIKLRLNLILLLLPLSTYAQVFEYGRAVVDTLASDSFYGRGYVNSGDRLAANYIAAEFDKIGLESFGKDYFQKFQTPVNTFPNGVKLFIEGKEMKPGIDFLIEASSPGVKGEFETVSLSLEDFFNRDQLIILLKSAQGKFVIFPEYKTTTLSDEEETQLNETINFIKYHPNSPVSGTISITSQKLTWGGATFESAKPAITLFAKDSTLNINNISIDFENQFYDAYETQNVLGYINGENRDSTVVLIAHYDHLGMMGNTATFNGANDNASGIALLLNLAKYYQIHTPKYGTVFIAFGGEELGLIGAKFFIENPLINLDKIKFLLNFDISGTGDDGIQVVNGKIHRREFDRLKELNQSNDLLKQVKIRGPACNSDHCLFHMKKVPCFFIYTLGGIQAYHDIYDRPETLPLTEFEDYFKLMTLFIDGL